MTSKCKLVVQAGAHDRSMCPVSVQLPESCADSPAFELKDVKTRKVTRSQITKSKRGITLTWLIEGLKAGSQQTLLAKALKRGGEQRAVCVEDMRDVRHVDVFINGNLFTSYHYGHEWVRPFLYPVIGPGGTQITRNWPILTGVKGEHADHPHHKSIWVAYGECGRVDNWSEEEGHGWQRHRAFLNKTSGPVFGQIVAKNDWCTNKGKKQFEETRSMRFYAVSSRARLVDVELTFHMTTGQTVFKDTKEGGLISVRVASSMDVRNGGRIENGYGGINEAETWGKSAPWCDYSGMVGGEHVGIAILDHETNPRYPTGWHVRDYGLMTANCFAWKFYRPEAKVKGDMTFKRGSKTTWRYRLYIHTGDARKGKVADRFHDYIAPPEVTVG